MMVIGNTNNDNNNRIGYKTKNNGMSLFLPGYNWELMSLGFNLILYMLKRNRTHIV